MMTTPTAIVSRMVATIMFNAMICITITIATTTCMQIATAPPFNLAATDSHMLYCLVSQLKAQNLRNCSTFAHSERNKYKIVLVHQ